MTTGLLERIMGAPAAVANPALDERYWGGAMGGLLTAAGTRVNADTAMKIATVYACLRIWGDVIGSLPLPLYRKLASGGKERAGDLKLYNILHDRPNLWQTSIEWRSLGMNHVLMRGNFYNQIIPDDRGFVDQLIPLHPDRVKPKLLPGGKMEYKVRQDNGTDRTLAQEQVFHLRGQSSDGITGMGILDAARESFGTALATDRHAANFFSHDATPGGVLTHAGKLSKEARDNLREEWQTLYSGANAQQIAVLQEGMTFSAIAMSHQDSQFLESRHFQVEEIARWFGIPLMMLQETDKATSWGTGVEQFQIAFVIHAVRPWCVRWEQAISRDLIFDTRTLFAEFLLDGLLRGDAKSRNEAYQIMRQNGIINANDWRELENMNPQASKTGDEYWRPANMVPADTPVGMIGSQRTGAASAQLQLIAQEAAARLVRKECTAVSKAAIKHAAANGAWTEWLAEFYHGFGAELMRDLHIGVTDARTYCELHHSLIGQMGARVAETLELDWINQLAKLALGGE